MIDSFAIENCPPSAFYISEFLNIDEEKEVMKNIYNAPKTKWTQLSRRRLQNWGGLPHPNGMVSEPIPQWLQTCMDKVSQLNIFHDHPPNHVLINEYKPKEGIMPHSDGPLYHPLIATLSLGSHTVLDFYKTGDKTSTTSPEFSLFLEPRSLLILKDDMYENYLHGIEERVEDALDDSIANKKNITQLSQLRDVNESIVRETRISLTIRHVLRVSKFKIRL